jgi:hypothetical protein
VSLCIIDYDDDWDLVERNFRHHTRWHIHWTMIVRHRSGFILAIDYADGVGDGDGSDTFPIEAYQVEEYSETVTKYRRLT